MSSKCQSPPLYIFRKARQGAIEFFICNMCLPEYVLHFSQHSSVCAIDCLDGWILAIKTQEENDYVEVHKNAKRERGQYPAILTELAWSIKDLLGQVKKKRCFSSPPASFFSAALLFYNFYGQRFLTLLLCFLNIINAV